MCSTEINMGAENFVFVLTRWKNLQRCPLTLEEVAHEWPGEKKNMNASKDTLAIVFSSVWVDLWWLPYHGAAERPEPPQQSDGEQEHEDEQSYGHKGPIGLEEKIHTNTIGWVLFTVYCDQWSGAYASPKL